MIPVFKELGINVLTEDKKNKGEKKESIEEDVLKKSNHEFVKLWLEYRKAEHSKTTFGQNILDQLYNGRLYSSFKIILDTGRIASRAGSINFLNFPSAPIVRKCFVSKKGFKMIVADHQAMEGRTTADITQDPVMIDSIINGKDLHAAYARLLNPEIAELSDEVISKQYKHLRQAAKAPRFAFQYGGTSYTVANNLNISIDLAQEYENKFKALHARIYEWGEEELKKVLKQGYVENALGFKLKLPQFEEYTEYEKWFHSRDKNFWSTYRIGKEEAEKVKKAIEHNKKEENKNNKIFYEVIHKVPYELFRESRVKVSGYFSLKSQYFRLVLNNTSQGLAAHQLKAAAIRLVDFIIDKGHTFRARLCNLIHDEVCMEVEDELCEIYKENLGLFMVEEGNKLLPNKVVFMEADANVGLSWYDAK